MNSVLAIPAILATMFLLGAGSTALADSDEFQVKRQEVFEFTERPKVTCGEASPADRFVITFASKGYCDATVAVEDSSGRIIRHLASGVLGPNAPQGFQENSLKQTVIWDGKNDRGEYVDDRDGVTVRVSLGLRPRLERTLYWSPHKRYGSMPLVCPAPEGVYVYDGRAVDFIRLFDHEGNYVRTVYPFPGDKLAEVHGLDWYDFPQGYRLPRKGGLYQVTLLSCGPNWHDGSYAIAQTAAGVATMAVEGQRLALAHSYLNRLATDGSTGGRPLLGPKTGYVVKSVADNGVHVNVGPSSIAFSPDGRTVYLTGYLWQTGSWRRVPGCYHAVWKLDYDNGSEMALFAGGRDDDGDDNAHFRVPTSVDTDAAGRVYVSDFLNDRVQIYDAAGEHLQTLATTKPAKVCVDRRSGEVWVFSYPIVGVPFDLHQRHNYAPESLTSTLTRFSAMPEGRQLSQEPFPLGYGETLGFEIAGQLHHVAVDWWAKEPTVWVVGRRHFARGEELHFAHGYDKADSDENAWKAGVRLQRRVDGKWSVTRSFGDDAVAEAVRPAPPRHNIQHCYVSPVSGKLYLAEADSGPTGKASNAWLEIDPETGKIKIIQLPFNALDAAFDLNGLVYLRNTDYIARYDMATWREVPWDYGELNERLGNDGGIHGRTTKALSALKMPSVSPVCYHQGGIYVAPNGNVLASCAYRYVGISSGHLAGKDVHQVDVYKPRLYPGRVVNSTSPCLHVWDKHGNLKYEDALPGVGQCDGVGLDRDDNIYVMHTPTRAIDGTRYFNEMSETLMKVRPNKAKVVSSSGSPVPLSPDERPARPPDLESTRHGEAWVEGTEWMYGGVGFAGFNMIGHAGGCACWFSRFTLDLFARSIAPEPDQFRVAVLDTNGNLILRIGQYGNVDDGRPLIATGGPANTRSIGGDEVSLVHACFVGTHTDRRVFIADMGNARVVSVKLDYRVSESVPLTTQTH